MDRKFTKTLILAGIALMIAGMYYSCKKIDLKREIRVITMETDSLGSQMATLEGEVVDVGERSISKYGFIYSESNPPMGYDHKIIAGRDNYIGKYSATAQNLEPDKTYYYMAFVEEADVEINTYGEVKSFKTLTPPALPNVATFPVINITGTSATCKGDVTSDGGSPVTKRGFCISEQPNPTVNGPHTSDGSGTGEFTHNFAGLTENTTYFVRAYALNVVGMAYGNQQSFTTNSGGPANEWLHYDDGGNANSIGLNDGGDFDVAIRLDPSQLQPYDGWKITKFRFFPVVGDPVHFSIEIFTGPTGSLLEYIQDVETVTPWEWNEVILDEPWVINANETLYPGYWVQNQPANVYPAGTDGGPAITGKGDLISVGGSDWEALSLINPDLDFNWNLQIFVTNAKGETKMIPVKTPKQKHQPGENPSHEIKVSAANPSNR
jgi:hypothetical protein